MIARHLCDIQMGLHASPGHLASVESVDTPDELAQLKRISRLSGRERNPFVRELESGEGVQFDEPDVCPGAPFAVAESVRVRCFVNWTVEIFAGHAEIRLTPTALASESRRSVLSR